MAPALAAAFTVLYLRPEISSGFYDFPVPPSATDVSTTESADPEHAPPPASSISGIPPAEAAFFLPNGEIVAEIYKRLQASGFHVVETCIVQLTKPQLRRLYFSGLQSDGDEATRTAFLDRFTRGPTLALLLSLDASAADAAVVALHTLLGPENPAIARQQALGAGRPVDHWPLRALCGLNEAFPALYASATLDCAVRERHELFCSPVTRSLDSAVLVLLPPLLSAVPDAKTQLLTAFDRHGVVVTSSTERSSLSERDVATITAAELHASTDASARETFRSQLLHSTADGKMTLVLRVVGYHLDATLRSIVGPACAAHALQFFPESLRAQLASSAPLVALDDDVKSHENGALCLETGLFLSLHLPTIQSLAPEDEHIDTTFAIIKPNAARDVATVAAIQHAIQCFGFTIDQQKRLRLSRAQAAAFYGEHTGKPFFERLVAFMTSGEIVALQLSRKLAIPLWRALMGPTNCLVARETHPWTLRAKFGIDGTQNATHGSDAPKSARRELRFFFGATPANAPVETKVVEAARVATTPLPMRGETLETVLVRGLDELLQRHSQQQEWSGALEACRWLGEWLLQQREQAQDVDVSIAAQRSSTQRWAAVVPTAKQPVGDVACIPIDEEGHRVVAIAVDASVVTATKDVVRQLVRDRATHVGYAFVDAAGVSSTASLVHAVANAGRRRVVLFDWDPRMLDTWRGQCGAFTISVIATVTTTATTPTQVPADPFVAYKIFEIPPRIQDTSPLLPLFRGVLDPRVVLLVTHGENGSHSETQWKVAADRAGFAWLSFESLVAREIDRENDPFGAFTQWRRTRAALAPSLVLDAIHRTLVDPAALGLAAAAHKFVLVGFPWESLDARVMERTVGRVSTVVRVGRGSKNESWGRVFETRGSLVHYPTASPVNALLSHVLMPKISVVLSSSDTDARSIKHEATTHGGGVSWIDATSLRSTGSGLDGTIVTLQRLLLRASVAHERVVLHNFPRTAEEATALTQHLAMPHAVVVVGSLPPALEPVLEYFQREAPHAIQSVVPSTVSPLVVRGLLHTTRVTLVVGDSSAIDTSQVRGTLVAMGVTLVDQRSDHNTDANSMLDAIASVPTARALVLCSGPTTLDTFHSLRTRLGTALEQLVVLKQRKAQPPPVRPRPGDDAYDDYDSEEERERERMRQREAATLAPALAQLAETAQTNSLRVRVVAFLHTSQVHSELVATLQPAVVCVRGNAHTFYRAAASAVCRALHVPFVVLCSRDPVAQLRGVLASSVARVVVVDGFPRTTQQGPSAAQQIRSLERDNVATVPLLVRFHASLDVLMEKYATVGRNALEDAQDHTVDAAADACFAARRLRDVSCERELHDAQDAFTHVLTSSGLV